MKLCSVVLLAVSVAFVCVDAVTLRDVVNECAKKNNCDMDTLKKNLGNPNASTNVKCSVDCMFKTTLIMHTDGTVNHDELDELISRFPENYQKTFKPYIEKCLPVMKAGMPKCESAFKLVTCVLKSLPKK